MSRHKGQDLAPLVVDAQRTRRRTESHLVQVGEQGVHCGSPRSGRSADGISDADNTIADVPTGQRLFFIALHRASVSDQLTVITQKQVPSNRRDGSVPVPAACMSYLR